LLELEQNSKSKTLKKSRKIESHRPPTLFTTE
jgi:hypothetical protein